MTRRGKGETVRQGSEATRSTLETAERADANFVVHATWALERTAGMVSELRAAGCDLAVIQAAREGVGLYRRLGFAAFGEITEYMPMEAPPGA